MAWDPRESDALHERALAFVRAFEAGAAMPEPFDALAVDLARFQAANVPGYGRLCAARGVLPSSFKSAGDAPAVPTDAFRVSRVAAFPAPLAEVTFRTSGTTVGARGSHAMRRPSTYDAAALAFGRWALTMGAPAWPLPGRAPPPSEPPNPGPFPRIGGKGEEATQAVSFPPIRGEGSGSGGFATVLILAPPPEELPDSSLSHMLQLFAGALGGRPATRDDTFIRDGILELAALDARVSQALVAKSPVLLLGTSFALVHLLDAVGEAGFRLPAGSRVMQTGGFKGRSREVDAAELRRELASAFGIDVRAVVSEYGMTELSSQFYEGTLRDLSMPHGVYLEPPWARVVPVDPVTLQPVAEGEAGVARIEDLMNVDSAFAVLAADRVRRVEGGFELLGRWPGALPRGCSIAVDEMLGPS